MPLTITQTVAPTVQPLTVKQAKDHLVIEHDSDNTNINRWIKSARRYVEKTCELQLITATWVHRLDCFPLTKRRAIKPPRPPLLTVSSIKYLDTAGTQQTLAAANYRVDIYSMPGRITEEHGKVWPTTRAVTNAVEVTYTAGFGAAGSNVPETIIEAMVLLIGHWEQNREASREKVPKEIEYAVKDLCAIEGIPTVR